MGIPVGWENALASAVRSGMVPANSGSPCLFHRGDHSVARFAVLVMLGVALLLAGCGRKGPLDPPPAAAVPVAGPDGVAVAEQPGEVTYGPDGQPIAPRGQRKRIFLDWLVD
jgi:predicted small lipoprotein YifL